MCFFVRKQKKLSQKKHTGLEPFNVFRLANVTSKAKKKQWHRVLRIF